MYFNIFYYRIFFRKRLNKTLLTTVGYKFREISGNFGGADHLSGWEMEKIWQVFTSIGQLHPGGANLRNGRMDAADGVGPLKEHRAFYESGLFAAKFELSLRSDASNAQFAAFRAIARQAKED